MIRVALIDDQPDFRKITRKILSLQSDIEIVGEGGNGVEALEVVEQVHPDVVLMDLHMPILDGVAATRQMHVSYPEVQVILFTSFDHDNSISEGIRAGAFGYLLKTAPGNTLVAAIRAASQA